MQYQLLDERMQVQEEQFCMFRVMPLHCKSCENIERNPYPEDFAADC